MKGLTQRIITAIIFVAIIVAGIFGGQAAFVVLSILIAILCSFELLGILLPKVETSLPKKIFGVILTLIPTLYIVDWVDTPIPFLGAIALVGAIVLVVELFSQAEQPFASAASLLITVIYIGVPIALLIDLAQPAESYQPILLFSIFLFTWANDTGAYFIGSFIGKHKLFERISPKKTIEGFIGGIAVAMIASYAFFHIFGILEVHQWLILAFIIGATATLGDLVESMLKRSKRIKDSGTFLPGHGGFLDRFDGFIFTIPFVYLYLDLFV